MSTAAPTLDDVRSLTEEVWASFLGEAEPLLPGAGGPTGGWSAAITVTGGWEGMVTVELTDRVAAAVTQQMLGMAEDEVASDEDVADAVGELVNMVGGNVKSLMPGPSTLSLPVVAVGRVARPSDAVEACRVEASWLGEPVVVSVHVFGAAAA
ncbi:chemotaxis protein CheX [Nocardioides perillae]|uniref:Chemotaxis protein CheX n=1 Tax=Nocardioides perillae TaxID=1119534 RepID=A0A7Y9UNC2_9ACTN|nr:chemotaxis protein CheX [Nocardioides perillae]NYG57027.1 chemotaxis protein CheX [Nocardioides perillae]